jgi:REP element-mobilizing transposase RayT
MLPGEIYHIYNRGNNRENIFKERKNYQFFLKRFKKYVLPWVKVHSYCLMPNHFHFLVRINPSEGNDEWENYYMKSEKKRILSPIEKGLRDFFISYAKSINKAYNRTGSLFQYKFKRKLIDSGSQFGNAILYIHYNPIASGFCKYYDEWQYSSFNSHMTDDNTFIYREEVLEWFGGISNFKISHLQYFEKMKK